MLDKPTHTRLRLLINKAMTPAIIRGFQPIIQNIVKEFLDKIEAQGGMDAIADLAYPSLPLACCV